jgi:thiosulfate/3-mercaptopyruvate sulfurtransferase
MKTNILLMVLAVWSLMGVWGGGAALAAESAAPEVRANLLVETDWLVDHLADPNVRVLHIAQTRKGYDAGHIPLARFVAWNDISTTVAGLPNELPPVEALTALMRRLGVWNTDRVVIYDEDGGMLAARAYVTLDYLGMGDRAALLNGQLKKWKAEGKELSKEKPPVTPSDFTAHVNRDVIVGFEKVRELAGSDAALAKEQAKLIDARPAKQYRGEEAGEGIARPGHIPGAVSVPWNCALESDANPTFLSAEEIRAKYAKAGVKPGEQVITYCRTGGQASFAYFTLKYLGYDPKMYDGSYWEWSRKEGTKVEK